VAGVGANCRSYKFQLEGKKLSEFFFEEASTGREFLASSSEKNDSTEQSKDVSECILKCNYFMQTDVLFE